MTLFNHSFQKGRSMIEMLGVLAIIGVLSIGGLAGYSMAMRKNKANNVLNELSIRAVTIATNFENYAPNQAIDLVEMMDPTDYTVTQKAISRDAFEISLSGQGISSGVCKKMLQMDLPTALEVSVDGVVYTGSNEEICESSSTPTMVFAFASDLSSTGDISGGGEDPDPELPACPEGSSCSSNVCDCKGTCIEVVS